jgi:hypothetical protein|tara:strand:+ start:1372 stop:1587 length:216 start_codon:yes stop_codon:yes gene_type:complete
MSIATPPPPLGDNWKPWGERINTFLTSTRNKLQFKDAESKATEDGILMWDAAQDAVVVSKNGAWVKLKYDP